MTDLKDMVYTCVYCGIKNKPGEPVNFADECTCMACYEKRATKKRKIHLIAELIESGVITVNNLSFSGKEIE